MIAGKSSWTPLLLSAVFAVTAGATLMLSPHLGASLRTFPAQDASVAAAPHREAVQSGQSPYNAIAHMDLEGQQAATLEFGPSSSQVVLSAAHVFNTITYGDDSHASYEDDRGNKANIVAVYLPKDYDAQNSENHGMYTDKAIIVLDRPVPGAGHFNLHALGTDNFHPLAANQAGYPFDRNTMSANIGGSLTGLARMPEHPSIYLLKHNLEIIPGDSGSPVWDQDGMTGIAQSNNYATPVTPAYIDAYNRVVQQTAAHPPAVQTDPPKVRILRIDM